MLHIEDQHYATCAPAITGVGIPASVRGRLQIENLDLSQQIVIIVDDCIHLVKNEDGAKEVPFSEIAMHLLDRAGINAVRQPINLDRLKCHHRTGDNGGPIDGLTDFISAIMGVRHMGIFVSFEDAADALKILSSADEMGGEAKHFTALTYRGAAQSFFGGAQCSMSAESILMSAEVFDAASKDLVSVQNLRAEAHRASQQ